VDWDNHGQGSAAIQLDAGKGIVTACTFGREGTDVRVGPQVRSAILSSNQAPGGFRIENHAGRRLQTAANEQNAMEEHPEALLNYRVQVGAEGDGYFLVGWHGQERWGEGPKSKTMRWSMGSSRLVLPVVKDRAYELEIELGVPQAAVSPEAGLYRDGKRIAELTEGERTIKAQIPASSASSVVLELRCKTWVPKEAQKGSDDTRTLGVSLRSVQMKAQGETGKAFEANGGE